MLTPIQLLAIKNDDFFKYMYEKVVKFDNYLDATRGSVFKIRGLSRDLKIDGDWEAVSYNQEWVHRFTPTYDRNQVHKVLCIRNMFRDHPELTPRYTMMISRTGSHASPDTRNRPGGLNHLQYLKKFQDASKKHFAMTNKYLGKIPRLSILEPHPTSGYVHAHDFYFLQTLPTENSLQLISNHYINTLKMGSPERAIKIEIKEPSEFKDIESFLAYFLGYAGFSTVSNIKNWTSETIIYNTCLWLAPKPFPFGLGKMVRVFTPSRELNQIIRQGHIEYLNQEHDSWGLTSQFSFLDTTLYKGFDDPRILHTCDNYDDQLKAYEVLGGDT